MWAPDGGGVVTFSTSLLADFTGLAFMIYHFIRGPFSSNVALMALSEG